MYLKPFCSAEWWTCIFQWSKFHFPIFQLPKPNELIYSDSVYQCLPLCKVWWSKEEYWPLSTSSNLDLILSKVQKQYSSKKLWFSFYRMFHKCRAVLHLAQMKYRNLGPERCKQIAIFFQGTSHQKFQNSIFQIPTVKDNIASTAGTLQVQIYSCKKWPLHFATISVSLSLSDWPRKINVVVKQLLVKWCRGLAA